MAKSENLTIMFTDIVGFTELTSTLSRASLRRLLHEHDRILMPICRAFGGRRVKSIGDALLLAFRSPTDAVRSAMAMQNALARVRREQPDLNPLHVRIAINVGEVRVERRDVFGEAVNVAARLEALTPPDAIYFTEAVYLSMNKAEVPSQALGLHDMRGLPEPVRVYCVPPHRVHRLVAAGEAVADPSRDPPFLHVEVPLSLLDAALRVLHRPLRAAHRHLTPAWSRAAALLARTPAPLRGLMVTVAACLTVGLFLLLMPADPAGTALDLAAESESSALLLQGEALLNRNDTSALAVLIEAKLKSDPRSADALLLRGHLAFAQKRSLNGIAEYSRALASNPALQNNARLARNLVGLLDSEPGAAKPLALQYPSESVLRTLSWRTGQPGYYGRAQAVALLRDLGRADRIDRFNHAVQELESRSECADRLAAVRQLRALKDPRAITHLEKASAGGLGEWFRQSCLRSEVQEALAELRGQSSRPKS